MERDFTYLLLHTWLKITTALLPLMILQYWAQLDSFLPPLLFTGASVFWGPYRTAVLPNGPLTWLALILAVSWKLVGAVDQSAYGQAPPCGLGFSLRGIWISRHCLNRRSWSCKNFMMLAYSKKSLNVTSLVLYCSKQSQDQPGFKEEVNYTSWQRAEHARTKKGTIICNHLCALGIMIS